MTNSFAGSLVPMVADKDFSPAFKKSAERVSKRVGMVANNVRAMANSPELGATMRKFLDDVWDHGELPKPMNSSPASLLPENASLNPMDRKNM